jgi:hypothetical protein
MPWHDLDRYEKLTEEQMEQALNIGLRLTIDALPQMKGKGAIVGALARDRAIAGLTRHLLEYFRRSGTVFARKPVSEDPGFMSRLR